MAEPYAHHLDRTTARQKDPYDSEPRKIPWREIKLKIKCFHASYCCPVVPHFWLRFTSSTTEPSSRYEEEDENCDATPYSTEA